MTQDLHAPAPSLSPLAKKSLIEDVSSHYTHIAPSLMSLSVAASLIEARDIEARIAAMLVELHAVTRDLVVALNQTRAS